MSDYHVENCKMVKWDAIETIQDELEGEGKYQACLSPCYLNYVYLLDIFNKFIENTDVSDVYIVHSSPSSMAKHLMSMGIEEIGRELFDDIYYSRSYDISSIFGFGIIYSKKVKDSEFFLMYGSPFGKRQRVGSVKCLG